MRPPRLALWLLDRAFDPSAAEAIAGDLTEEFHAIAARRGRVTARTWFWRQTLLSLASRRHRASVASAARDRRPRLVEDLGRDLALTVRMLARAPGFASAAILTLALGIGAATAISTAAHRTLLRPLPYPHGARLVFAGHPGGDGGAVGNVGYTTAVDWRARLRTFDDLAVIRTWSPTLVAEAGAERLDGLRVTWNYFRTLGVQPAHGRDFTAGEDHPERWRVVILADRLWRRRFGARPDIIGRTLEFNGGRYEVVGVLPPSFEPLVSEHFYRRAEIWAPLGYDPAGPASCPRAST